MNTQQSITIIGGGCSGSLVAAQLLGRARTGLVIHLIERRPDQLGRGVAYSTQTASHLLNVPANNMSAFPDHPNHFLDWVQNQEHLSRDILAAGVQPNTFVPRLLYGTYLQSVLNQAEAKASSGVCLEIHQDEAVAIELQANSATVHLQSKQVLHTQKIVLALGNFPPSNPSVQSGDFYKSSRYTSSAWAANALNGLNPDQPILLIGSGLTMVDQAIALFDQGHQGKIHVVSRHGLLPQRHNQCDSELPTQVQIRSQPLRNLVHQIRQQARQTEDWRTVIDSIRPVVEELWQALCLREQRQFLRHVQPYWGIHRHRIAPDVADVIDNLLHKGQLIVHAGRIQAYQEDRSGVDVIVRQRHPNVSKTLRVSRVVNCTGPNSKYSSLPNSLIVNLRSQGLLCPDSLGLGLNTAPNGALLNTQGIASKFLYTLGPTRKGGLFETVAVPEIRAQALALAQELLTQLEIEADLSLETQMSGSSLSNR